MFNFKVNVTVATVAVKDENNYKINTCLFSGKLPKKVTTPAIKDALHTDATELSHKYYNVACEADFDNTLEDAIKNGLKNENIEYDFIIETDSHEEEKEN